MAIARYGGEEFVLLMSSFDRNDCITKLEELLEVLRITPISLDQNGSDVFISASVGAITMTGPLFSQRKLEEVIDMADKNLYKAKDVRDCVKWSHHPSL